MPEGNFEYPIKAGVKLHPIVAGWGKFKADDTFLSKIAEHRTQGDPDHGQGTVR